VRHLSYVFVLAGALVGALWLEPVLRVGVLRRWRRLLATLLPVAVVFGAWDIAAIRAGHWSFDPAQTTGVRLPCTAPGGAAVLPCRTDLRDPRLRGGSRRPPPPRLALGQRTLARRG